MAENWLITGGCGFIGRNLIKRLLQEPDVAIRVLDNCSVCGRGDLEKVCAVEIIGEGAAAPAPGEVQLYIGDIINPVDVAAACDNMDVIVHLAANTGVPKSVADPEADFRINAQGTFNMLEGARNACAAKFIFASSGAPTGNATPPITEKSLPAPVSPYGASKMAGEGYCSAWRHCFGLDTIALRFSNVYGPYSRHKTSVVAKFLNSALEGKDWTIYGDGSQVRDFLYVEDLVEAIWMAAKAQKGGGEIFQIATGHGETINGLINGLAKALADCGVPVRPVHNEQIRQGDIIINYANPEKARQLLGWQADTQLEQGLARTVRWFCESR